MLTKDRLFILILDLTNRLSVLITEGCCSLSVLLIYNFYQYFLISGDKLYVFFLSLVLISNNYNNNKPQAFVRVSCLFVALKHCRWKRHWLLQTSKDFLCQSYLLRICPYVNMEVLLLKSKLHISSWFIIQEWRPASFASLHFHVLLEMAVKENKANNVSFTWITWGERHFPCISTRHLVLFPLTTFPGLSLQTVDTKTCILFHLLAA